MISCVQTVEDWAHQLLPLFIKSSMLWEQLHQTDTTRSILENIRPDRRNTSHQHLLSPLKSSETFQEPQRRDVLETYTHTRTSTYVWLPPPTGTDQNPWSQGRKCSLKHKRGKKGRTVAFFCLVFIKSTERPKDKKKKPHTGTPDEGRNNKQSKTVVP